MIGRIVDGLLGRLGRFRDLADPEERIEGSGEAHLDPAYNGRYTAERRLRALSKAGEEAGSDPANESGGAAKPDGERR